MFLALSSSALVSWFLIYYLFWFLINLFTSKFISLYFIIFSVFWSFNRDSFAFTKQKLLFHDYKHRSLHRNIYKIITFTLLLLNVVCLQIGLQEICCCLECHPTCQFRIFILPVLDVIYCVTCAQIRVNPYAEQHRSILSFTLVSNHDFHSTN